MPLFNDRRNTNPATDIADYNDSNKPVSNPSLRAMGFPKKNTLMSRADSDRFETAEYYGPGGKGAGPNAKADAAYQNSYIKRAQKASDTQRLKNTIRGGLGMAPKLYDGRITGYGPQYTTPGGLVLNELKKNKNK